MQPASLYQQVIHLRLFTLFTQTCPSHTSNTYPSSAKERWLQLTIHLSAYAQHRTTTSMHNIGPRTTSMRDIGPQNNINIMYILGCAPLARMRRVNPSSLYNHSKSRTIMVHHKEELLSQIVKAQNFCFCCFLLQALFLESYLGVNLKVLELRTTDLSSWAIVRLAR